jgi:hypothetical protein
VFVQWCAKGVNGDVTTGGIDDAAVQAIVGSLGLRCNRWRALPPPEWTDMTSGLTSSDLDRHVHAYGAVQATTPFLSLSAGCVDRDVYRSRNISFPAHMVAVDFATDGGTRNGYVFYCWVLVGLRPAVGVQALAEERRELSTYGLYGFSAWHREGEVTAKVYVPANQVERCEKYTANPGGMPHYLGTWHNPQFLPPDAVLNIREAI